MASVIARLLRLLMAGDTRLSESYHGLFFVLYALWIVLFDPFRDSPFYASMIKIAPSSAWALLLAGVGALRWWGVFGGITRVRLLASYGSVFLLALLLYFAVGSNIRALLIPTWIVILLSALVIHIQLTVRYSESRQAVEKAGE